MGRRPIALSDVGRAQASALVAILRALSAEHVVTSPLARARETAEIVAGALALPVVAERDLAELDFGEWEGRSYDDLVADPAYLAFSADPVAASPPGGESVIAAQSRACAALTRVLATSPGGRVCVVTHGDVLRLILAAALALDVREFRRLRVDTGGVSAIDLTGDWAEVKFTNLLPDPARVSAPLHWR